MRFTLAVKSSEALPSQVVQVVTKVIEEQRAGKGHIFLDHTAKGTLEAQRAQYPLLEA